MKIEAGAWKSDLKVLLVPSLNGKEYEMRGSQNSLIFRSHSFSETKEKKKSKNRKKLKNLYMWIVYSLNLIQLQTIFMLSSIFKYEFLRKVLYFQFTDGSISGMNETEALSQ